MPWSDAAIVLSLYAMPLRFFQFVFGPSSCRTLEQHIVTLAAFLVMLTGILTTLQNILTGNPAIHSVYSSLAAVAGAGFFCVSRSGVRSKPIAASMVLFFLTLIVSGWFPVNGSFGAMPYFYYMLFIFSVIVLSGKTRCVFLGITMTILVVIMIFEQHHPGYLLSYKDSTARYVDILVAMVISMGVTGLLVYLVVTAYCRERDQKARLFNDVLRSKHDLEQALAEIKILKTYLPICAHCKKIRNDEGYWQDVAAYITAHTDTIFSHSICPDCYATLSAQLKTFPW